jgi:hypothetical protein
MTSFFMGTKNIKLGIMQPYLFPYLGYFKLISSVDTFVFYDDVGFINKGWINRNRIISSGVVKYFTVSLEGASQNKRICDIKIASDSDWQIKLRKNIEQSYSKAENFSKTYELIEPILFGNELKISEMSKLSVEVLSNYLEIDVTFVKSSTKYNNETMKGQERIVDICKQENAKEYINLPGGKELYDDELFCKNNIKLSFVNPNLPIYHQNINGFVPGLSIIDVLMHNKVSYVKEMLK